MAKSVADSFMLIKVAIVEDSRTIRESLRRIIDDTPGMRCECAVGSAEEALAEMPRCRPDVILMDIHLPNISGIECTGRLKETLPETDVIMLTVYEDNDKIFRALQAGAQGYLLKDMFFEELEDVIRKVHAGARRLPPVVAERLAEVALHEPTEVLPVLNEQVVVEVELLGHRGDVGVRTRTLAALPGEGIGRQRPHQGVDQERRTEDDRDHLQEAARHGVKVAAHAHGTAGIKAAARAGVTSIEHGTYLYQDPTAIHFMAEHGIFLIPTLKVGWDIIHANDPTIPGWIVEKNKATQGEAELSLKRAYEAGVPIAMGSDVGTPLNFHGENGLEIYWMQQAGVSAMDAIIAATGNAARALGWESMLGTLEAGKVADLIVLDTNPLDDLRLLADKNHLRFVMKDGKVVACHADHDLPSALFAKQALLIE